MGELMAEQMWSVDFRPIRSTYGTDMAKMFRVMYRAARRAFKRAGLKTWKSAPMYPPLVGAEAIVIDNIRLCVQYNVIRDEYVRRADVLVDV